MRVTATESEKKLVAATLKFANMRRVRSTKEVEQIFSKLPFVGLPDPKHADSKIFLSLNPDGNPKREKEGMEAFQNDLNKLKSQLQRIATADKQRRAEVAREVEAVLGRTVPFWFKVTEDGLRFMYALGGVEACFSYAAALILDPERGLLNRLGLCDAPRCERLNLTFEGRPQRYCNEKHRRAADLKLRSSERVKEWRKWVRKHGGKRKRELRG